MFDELAGLFQPQQAAPAQPDPGLKAEWDGFLSNPKNRAGLLSFGLGLMTPTWGNSFANALGAGAEAYGAVEKEQQAEAIRQENAGRSVSEKQKDRDLQRELNDADNKAALERTKYSSDAATSRAGMRGASYSKGAQSLFNRTYAETVKSLKNPNILANGYDPDAPPLTEEEIDMQATAAASRAADAFEHRFGTGTGSTGGAGTGGGGASNSQISPGTGAGGDSAPTGKGAPAANVGAGNNSTSSQGATISADDIVTRMKPETLDAVLAKPNADDYFKQYGLNSRAVIAAKARRDAMNWLQNLQMPGFGQTPGVATPSIRGPGTGQVK
jgi:hypothetical protein